MNQYKITWVTKYDASSTSYGATWVTGSNEEEAKEKFLEHRVGETTIESITFVKEVGPAPACIIQVPGMKDFKV